MTPCLPSGIRSRSQLVPATERAPIACRGAVAASRSGIARALATRVAATKRAPTQYGSGGFCVWSSRRGSAFAGSKDCRTYGQQGQFSPHWIRSLKQG